MKNFLFVLALIGSLMWAAKAETRYDFDGDGKSDFGIIRNLPTSTAGTFLRNWFVAKSSDNTLIARQWGYSVNGGEFDLPRPFDYDGDNKTDFAVQRFYPDQDQTVFFILNSADNTLRIETFGLKTDDSTVIGDYDGDGKADLCVFRNGASSQFIYKGSLNNPDENLTFVTWGNVFTNPYRGDFDGDNKLDFCVRFTNQSLFALKRSSDGGTEFINWGITSDTALEGDYDGDGRTDFCVRRSNGTNYNWYILERDGGGTGGTPIVWGIADSNIAFDRSFGGADFDGDGRDDIGVYRLGSPNTFYIRKSADGQLLTYQLGSTGFGDNLYYFR